MCKRVLYLAPVKTINTMKTLFERLRPEQRERLQEMEGEFPYMHRNLLRTLKKFKYVVDIPFGEVVNVVQYLTNETISITAIYNCFEDVQKTGDDPSLQSDHNAQTTNT
jgi:arylamine N-acetyltransferase